MSSPRNRHDDAGLSISPRPNPKRRGRPPCSRLIFCILWTVLSTILIVGNFDDLVGWERLIALAVSRFSVFAIYATWRYVATPPEPAGRGDAMDVTWYVWIEIDGSERRSTRDPRDDWDSDGGRRWAATAAATDRRGGRPAPRHLAGRASELPVYLRHRPGMEGDAT
jgi:hypothetical protein